MNENNNKTTINHYKSQTNISSFRQFPTFTTAHKLISDKFCIDISKKRNKKQLLELTIGDKICIVKPSSNLVCDTIVRGILPKRHDGLESPTVYVLVTDNKFDFYKITDIANNEYHILDKVLQNVIIKRMFTLYQLADFLIRDLEKDIKKFKSKLVIITGDFFLNDQQITKHDKDRLYPRMIESINQVRDSIILLFSSIKLRNIVNY